MKKKELSELKIKNISDLTLLVDKKGLDYYKIITEIKAGKEKNLKKAAVLRRDIAQIKTLITQMQILEKEDKK